MLRKGSRGEVCLEPGSCDCVIPVGAFRPHNHAACSRGYFNLRPTAMPPMLCCVSASVQSLMLYPCHHVSACGAFGISCGGVHHVEHLLFLWSHTFRPVKPNLAPVLWRSLRSMLRSNLSSVRTIKECKQQQFMATHYCHGAPRSRRFRKTSLRRQCSHVLCSTGEYSHVFFQSDQLPDYLSLMCLLSHLQT